MKPKRTYIATDKFREARQKPRRSGFRQFAADHCVVGQEYTVLDLYVFWDAAHDSEEKYGIERPSLKSIVRQRTSHMGFEDTGRRRKAEMNAGQPPKIYVYTGVCV